MRTLERNKTNLVKYANRASETTDSYGMPTTVYGEIASVRLALVPLSNVAEATNYGVNLDKSYKVILNANQCSFFNEFTRIWIDTAPNSGKTNYDYTVSVAPLKSINNGTMVITKRAGS